MKKVPSSDSRSNVKKDFSRLFHQVMSHCPGKSVEKHSGSEVASALRSTQPYRVRILARHGLSLIENPKLVLVGNRPKLWSSLS